jgi:hypothetical protein
MEDYTKIQIDGKVFEGDLRQINRALEGRKCKAFQGGTGSTGRAIWGIQTRQYKADMADGSNTGKRRNGDLFEFLILSAIMF